MRAWHQGETAVQQRAGYHRNGGVGVRLPDAARDFLAQRQTIILGGRDLSGRVWAGALYGPQGFLQANNQNLITLDVVPDESDPLRLALRHQADVGAIAIEPQTRRRMRVNGRLHDLGDHLVIEPDQVFANCPKYIAETPLGATDTGYERDWSTELSLAQQAFIATIDTFFVASHVDGHGADASHRGGQIRVTGPKTLSWPDYRGNAMFMTLGNLELDPACGLFIPDRVNGEHLRLTGTARVDWDPAAAATFEGAERVVHFDVSDVVQSRRP